MSKRKRAVSKELKPDIIKIRNVKAHHICLKPVAVGEVMEVDGNLQEIKNILAQGYAVKV